MNVTFQIDNESYTYVLEGDFFWGKDEVLFQESDHLTRQCSWHEAGYTLVPLPNASVFPHLQKDIQTILQNICTDLDIYLPADFQLEDYHQYVSTAALHQQVIARTRWLTRHDFSIDWSHFCSYISRILNHPVHLDNPLLEKEIIILRISRPQSYDINPLHRDGYLDIWKDTVNLWIPIAGSNQYSSLPVLPGSHLWNEKDILRTASKGASLNGLLYHVPAIAQAHHPLNLIRPNPQFGEILLFTPFLIHGSAFNQHNNTTRFALELRLHSQKKPYT